MPSSLLMTAISIHAPTRGATLTSFPNVGHQDFNPRSYKRSDLSANMASTSSSLFQSTLLQEERPFCLAEMLTVWRISIHAPTRGATSVLRNLPLPTPYFNPRSYKRSDIHSPPYKYQLNNFNPRSYKRSDQGPCECLQLYPYFNPRSYKRSDSKNAQYSLCISAIIIA